MRKALYYPHIMVRDPSLLQTGLLLWDEVECIVPRDNYPLPRFKQRSLNEAADILVRPCLPTKRQRAKTERMITEFLGGGVPRSFRLSKRADPHLLYRIDPGKLNDATRGLLTDVGLARAADGVPSLELEQKAGLLVMSFLAKACAGSRKEMITDRHVAYSTLAEEETFKLGGIYQEAVGIQQVSRSIERLVNISVEIVDCGAISIERLLGFRKRELKERGGDLRALRTKYRETVLEYVRKFESDILDEEDYNDLVSDFRAEMKQHLKDLKSELRIARNKALTSKPMWASVLAGAGVFAGPLSITLPIAAGILKAVGVGALINEAVKYKERRREVLRDNAMSLLYLTSRHRWM